MVGTLKKWLFTLTVSFILLVMSLCCRFSLNKQQEKAETVVLENVSIVAKEWYASVPVQEKVIFV